MGNRIKSAAAILAAFTFGSAAMAQDATDASTVVATVNGKEITVGHMILSYNALPAQFKQYPSQILFDAIYNQLIEQTLLAESVTGELPARVTYGIENETRNLLASVVVEQVFDDAVTEDAIAAAYQTQYVDADLGIEYSASHVLVNTQEEAFAIIEEIDTGLDFAEAAMEYSTGPSGPSGGSLGWFQRGDMVGPFDAAVAAMEVGTVSDPVQTSFGWHIIALHETREIEPLPLDVVREELIDELGSAALGALLEGMQASAEVTRIAPEDFDTSVIMNQDLLEK